MTDEVIKKTIESTEVEVNIKTGVIQFKFMDTDEGVQEILSFIDGDALLNFLQRVKDIRGVVNKPEPRRGD